MDTNDDDLDYLNQLSGFSRRKCAQALKRAGGDRDAAGNALLRMRHSSLERAADSLLSYARLEKGKRLCITDGEETLLSMPYLLAASILLVLSFSSRIIGVTLFALLLFGLDIRTETIGKKTDEIDSAILSKRKAAGGAPAPPQPVQGADEYNEYTME